MRLKAVYLASVSLSFEIILLSPVELSNVNDFMSFFSNSFETFAGYDVRAGNRGATLVNSAGGY